VEGTERLALDAFTLECKAIVRKHGQEISLLLNEFEVDGSLRHWHAPSVQEIYPEH
jgi:hypothetical protein